MTSEREWMAGGAEPPGPAGEYGLAAGTILLASAAGFLLRSRLLVVDVAMLYLLAVVFVAARARPGPAVLASVLGTALLDFLFVPPYYTFGVQDVRYLPTFAVMLAVSLTMTRLTARLREQARAAQAAERRTAAVAALDRELGAAASREDVLAAAARHLGRAGGGEAAVALVGEPLLPDAEPAWPEDGVFDNVEVRMAAAWAHERGESVGSGTRRGAGVEALVVPLRTPARRLGVVAVRPEPVERMITADERRTVEALAERLAAELERATRATAVRR